MTDGTLGPIGLGTGIVEGEDCTAAVRRALAAGYRHVDTAEGYGNERAVAEGVRRSPVPREDVLVATKVLSRNLGYEDVLAAADRSRERTGFDVLDLLYVHWPTHAYDPAETLAAFDELVDRGAVARVGVSSFDRERLAEARDHLDAPVAANQIEHHPTCPQADLVEHCHDRGIAVVGYSPLADGRALELPAVRAVAAEREATPAQVCLAWSMAKGVVPVPKATGEHVPENYGAVDLELTGAELARIDAVDRTERVYDPDWAPWN